MPIKRMTSILLKRSSRGYAEPSSESWLKVKDRYSTLNMGLRSVMIDWMLNGLLVSLFSRRESLFLLDAKQLLMPPSSHIPSRVPSGL